RAPRRLRPRVRAHRRLRHGHGQHPRRHPVPPHAGQRRVLTRRILAWRKEVSAREMLCRGVGSLSSPRNEVRPTEEAIMPRGDKSKYTDKQKRKAEHIEEGYEDRGVPAKVAKSRAWATVNKESGGGKKSGSGRGKPESHASSEKGGRKG